ncbi:MAG: sensor histidine kinase [bacterium]
MSTPDVLRALGCWLWQIDPATERVVTIGGRSPFDATTASWRTMLRQCAAEDRHALLDAVRRLGSSDEDGTLRVENLAIPAAGGHGHHIDLLIGRQRDGTGARHWSGMVSRRWPTARRPASAVEPSATSVAGELDAAGLGWWSMENAEDGLSLSRTAARLMGFGDSACKVPLGAWLAAAPPQECPRLMRQMERILDGKTDRFELDLHGLDPARPQAGLRLTAFRARAPGNGLVGVIEALSGIAVHPLQRPSPTGPAGAPSRTGTQPSTDTGLDRDSLVREIHHRIKNHLQGMTGLIERYRNDYPALGEALDAIGGQLHSIGTVYGLLARSGRSDLALDEIAQAVTDGLSGIAVNGVQTRFPDAMGCWRIAEQHCVAIALVVNELLMNAIKHGGSRPGMPPVAAECELVPQGCTLRIRNDGTLPPGFDFDAGTGARTGLQLVRAMLPGRGAKLSICAVEGKVEVSLLLEPPVLSAAPEPKGTMSHPEETRIPL